MQSAKSPIFIVILFQIGVIRLIDGFQKCDYDLSVLWTRELGHSPFAAAPLIADVDADGQLDVVAAPFLDEVSVLRGRDGRTLSASKWPFVFVDVTTHSSPLAYDITGDGMNDIVVTTSDGQLLFFSYDGTPLTNFTFQLPGLQVEEKWYESLVNADTLNIHDKILDEAPVGNKTAEGYIAVDPHVLATPVIADLNRDGKLREMVISVSYYFDVDLYSNSEYLPVPVSEMYNYLASAIVILDLPSLRVRDVFHLELTVVKSEFPGYALNSPTLINLEGDGGPLQIVVGTSGGHVYALNPDGSARSGFPVTTDSVHGQVLVADVNSDGLQEIVVMDTSANVACYDAQAQLLWEASVSGTSSSGARLADVNLDGSLELVISTNDGKLWVLSGADGQPVSGWPFRVGSSHDALPLVTQLDGEGALDIIMLADDEYLHVVSGDRKCRNNVMRLGEKSFVAIVTHDLVPTSPGLELLIATSDGTLLCLGRAEGSTVVSDDTPAAVYAGLLSLPSETKSYNNFHADGRSAVIIERDEDEAQLDVVGRGAHLTYELIDYVKQPVLGSRISHRYSVQVYFGRELIAEDFVFSPGRYRIYVPAPSTPCRGHLTLHVTNLHGRLLQDQVPVRFNMAFLQDLPWLLLCPFVAMAVILLLLHGYPAADLLPTTIRQKGR